MGEIYEKILALLMTIPEIKWVDLDSGQLEQERPPVSFPCALVSLRLSGTDDLDMKKTQQVCTAGLTIRLAFDFTQNTSSVTPPAERTKGLNIYAISDKIFDVLQGYTDANINEITRRAVTPELRPDNIKVLNNSYTTEFHQQKS